jgi:chorismate-pyruvate lyase
VELLDKLKQFDLPTTLRICAGTDGSVTYLLEVMTHNKVEVITRCQKVITATDTIAKMLMIMPGEPVNHREVMLQVQGIPYVLACSLAPVSTMPQCIKDDLMQADIPIGRILREHKLEIRRDILNIEIKSGEKIFNDIPVLSREYVIIHDEKILIWINELFPVDDRWDV